MILSYLENLKGRKKAFAWLLDPDKCSDDLIGSQLKVAETLAVDLIFIGGSLISNHIDKLISRIKSEVTIPVILFPGSPLQLSAKVDAILFLSLISGRNPEYLIGNHVIAAPFLRDAGVEIIPTGYMLINGGQQTSVSYMSNTQPLPSDKTDIALATAMAGEMLGLRVVYLDTGSGAMNPVPVDMIASVSAGIQLPVMVGGGLRTPLDVRNAYQSGADVVIVGTAAENCWESFGDLVAERDRFNS
jgi:phosphoglycerol geranylgeranyltransferase